jgi:hypothetical protein
LGFRDNTVLPSGLDIVKDGVESVGIEGFDASSEFFWVVRDVDSTPVALFVSMF